MVVHDVLQDDVRVNRACAEHRLTRDAQQPVLTSRNGGSGVLPGGGGGGAWTAVRLLSSPLASPSPAMAFGSIGGSITDAGDGGNQNIIEGI